MITDTKFGYMNAIQNLEIHKFLYKMKCLLLYYCK